jgi:isocitrate dehydrogenase
MNCRERLGIRPKVVTYDLSRRMEGARETKCSQFARAVARSIYDAQ